MNACPAVAAEVQRGLRWGPGDLSPAATAEHGGGASRSPGAAQVDARMLVPPCWQGIDRMAGHHCHCPTWGTTIGVCVEWAHPGTCSACHCWSLCCMGASWDLYCLPLLESVLHGRILGPVLPAMQRNALVPSVGSGRSFLGMPGDAITPIPYPHSMDHLCHCIL